MLPDNSKLASLQRWLTERKWCTIRWPHGSLTSWKFTPWGKNSETSFSHCSSSVRHSSDGQINTLQWDCEIASSATPLTCWKKNIWLVEEEKDWSILLLPPMLDGNCLIFQDMKSCTRHNDKETHAIVPHRRNISPRRGIISNQTAQQLNSFVWDSLLINLGRYLMKRWCALKRELSGGAAFRLLSGACDVINCTLVWSQCGSGGQVKADVLSGDDDTLRSVFFF